MHLISLQFLSDTSFHRFYFHLQDRLQEEFSQQLKIWTQSTRSVLYNRRAAEHWCAARPVPWQGSPVPPGRGAPAIRRGPTIYIVLVS